MASLLTELQRGIYAHLTASAELRAFVGANGVVDQPRLAPSYPFVRFGLLQCLPDDTDLGTGMDVELGLEAWSRPAESTARVKHAGRIEAVEIGELLRTLMHRREGDITIRNAAHVSLVDCVWQSTNVTVTEGYEDFVSDVRFRITIEIT